MERILLFLAFLVVYGLYLWTSVILFNRFLNKTKKNSFVENELMIVIPYFFFFAFIFLIGRFFNLHLFTLSILFSNIGLLITVIVWSLIGNPKIPFKEIGGWAGSDFGMKNSWLTIIPQGLILLMLIAFPIVIGVNFFSQSSEDAIRIITIKYSLILILGSYVSMLPVFVGILSSSFIDEDTRARYFITQFSGLIAYSLFLSLLFWIFNLGKTGHEVQLGNVNFNLSPQMFLIVMGFLLAFLILPYFIGIQKAKRLKNDYLETNKLLLGNIVEAINLATENTLISRIENLEKQITAEYTKLVETDKGIETGLRFDELNSENDLLKTEILQYQYYKVARAYDARFSFYDFLNETYKKLEELKKLDFDNNNSTANNQLLEKYVAHFKAYKEELSKKDESKGKTNPALWIGIITILSPFISQLMSEIGKYLIEIFKNM